ncbi:DOT1-domain-containing protein [Piedraia hortae CBS 480.64]|uniref:Histone-lysine N-methyltransferase, H3 lysine-79 specific n=1 Tax=Piedraia hortae CBS 480.64 TaxID=1314780 RepID=A0A6A7BXZ5_9PEZI|nr:DOT1-domain-containing protein [Piedraia hortae CBS 480.64]
MNFFKNPQPKPVVVRHRVPATAKKPPAKPTKENVTPVVEKAAAKRYQLSTPRTRCLKRKSATPDVAFSSSSDSEQEDATPEPRKRPRMLEEEEVTGPPRKVVRTAAFASSSYTADVVKDLIHGASLTSGHKADKLYNHWESEGSSELTIELQYPTAGGRERFELKWPRNDDYYNPLEDMRSTIETIIDYYVPPAKRAELQDVNNGIERRLRRAFRTKDLSAWKSAVADFNAAMSELIASGAMAAHVASQSSDLKWIQKILDQTFSRTVSPNVAKLRAYKSGSDNVYGELLPRFSTEIFRRTGLSQNDVFIDLGSGVANVVLQAALETGCEAHGIEMMKNPCELARLQSKEFLARVRGFWGLQPGTVNLMDGDMTLHPDIPALLQRADVVLVNNQVFTPALNEKLRDMFLDLKEGARVVSLKPFVPECQRISLRNMHHSANMFVQQKFDYYSDMVSWSHGSHVRHWYIATKDLRPLKAFQEKVGLDL